MTDQVVLDGKTFISSRRAAEVSHYSRDYIGQLARAGLLDARRIGSSWYITNESLERYTSDPASIRSAESSLELPHSDDDASITFDGLEYVPATRAATLTGYHQDYIGQLARAGKVPSRQVGARWFIERQALESHKEAKDALLRAVQAEAVGLRRPALKQHSELSDLHYRYVQEGALRDLVPTPRGKLTPAQHAAPAAVQDGTSDWNRLPIQRMRRAQRSPRPSRKKVLPAVFSGALTVVIVLSVGFFSFKNASVYASVHIPTRINNAASAALPAGAAVSIAEAVERLFGTELVYLRS